MSSDCVSVIGTMVQSITAIALGIFAYKQMNITDKQKEIAAQQSSILQAQNNLSLFEKRFKVYESLANLVAAGLREADISNDEFQKEFDQINNNPDIDGILLLRPLPKHIDEKAVENRIDPRKDLDGISPVNLAKVYAGDETGYKE